MTRTDSDIMVLSVCLPTYNGERFVADALRSIVCQTLDTFELIVVDDCSEDRTIEVVQGFSDPRMTIHRNDTRLGIPGNWNRCLDLSNGEYVCIFHQDDLMQPENLERKLATLTADPSVGLVHSAAQPRVEVSIPQFSARWMEQSPDDFVIDGPTYLRKLLLRGNSICAPTVVVRRDRLVGVGGFDTSLHFACDYEMWMRLCVDNRVAYLASPLVTYRWHALNATHDFGSGRGSAEIQGAARSVLSFYRERTGRAEEADLLTQALETLWETRGWLDSLEAERANLRRAAAGWQEEAAELRREAAELRREAAELRREAAELRQHLVTLENQRATWQREAEQRERYLQELEAGLAFRVLARLRLLPRRSPDGRGARNRRAR